MTTSNEKSKLMDRMVEFLRARDVFSEESVIEAFRDEFDGNLREIRLALWEAREHLRLQEGIDFGPMPKTTGWYERKQWHQVERRAQRQRAKGSKAYQRSEERFRLAAEMAPADARERLNTVADRMLLRMAMRSAKES